MAQWQCCVFQFSTLMISFKPRGLLRIEWQNECLSWPSASHASSMALKQLSKTGVRVPRLSVSWPWQALQTWPSACTLSRCAVEWPSISLSLSSRERKKQVTFNKIIVPRSRVRVFASHFAGRPSLRGGASSAIAAPASVSSASRRRVIE